MSSASSDISDDDVQVSINCQFVDLISKYKVVLNKSQVPKIKAEKEKAVAEMVKEYGKLFGKEISIKQLQKKIHNMKREVKKKIDKNVTGNKKIVLKDWEKTLISLLEVDKNPVFQKVPGAMSVGQGRAETSVCSTSSTSISADPPCTEERKCNKRPKVHLQLFESEETKNLGNTELQRLVLLEQLQLIRMQKEKEKLILEKLKQERKEEHDVVSEGSLTYFSL